MSKISRRHALTLFAAAGVAPSILGRSAFGQERDWHASNNALKLVVRPDESYEISLFGKRWLTSDRTALHCSGWHADVAKDGQKSPLRKLRSESGFSRDHLGRFAWRATTWLAGRTRLVTSFRVYSDRQCIVFSQHFPHGASGLSLPQRSAKPVPKWGPATDEKEHAWVNDAGVCSIFPSFRVSQLPDLGYLSFKGCFAHPQRGRKLDGFLGGTESGVPLVLFDDDLHTAVLSPLNHFLSAVQLKTDAFDDCLACGLNGRTAAVEPGFTQEFVLYAGRGVNQTMHDWGSLLLSLGGKSRSAGSRDRTLGYIGYWTSAGAYYYYNQEPGKNYEQTFLDIAGDLRAREIPVGYMHVDSYVYPKGADSGTVLWEPQKELFPHSLGTLSRKLGLPLAAHNRFWSAHNAYIGRYPFLISPLAALPISSKFWHHIMSYARNNGIVLYEQDWLNAQYEESDPLQSDPLRGEQWLRQMSEAATAYGVHILYCMPLPSFYLASTQCQAVTQVRASEDYHPGSDQWKIGMNSLLAWSVGLMPFKDTFWSTETQPGDRAATHYEPNPELELLVAVLSCAAVGPGDKIGSANKQLLLRACRADGLLLKPDKPATPLDKCFTRTAPAGELWDTFSKIGHRQWTYLFSANQPEVIDVTLDDLKLQPGKYVALDTVARRIATLGPDCPLAVGGGSPPRPGAVVYQLFVVAPQGADGTAFLGELNKSVTVSGRRFTAISADNKTVELTGVAGEPIELSWFSSSKPLRFELNGTVIDCATTSSQPGSQPAAVRCDDKSGIVTLSFAMPQTGRATATFK